ncbi:ryanodine receptor 1-like, partial [Geospiza fortis]|uniref:Ryanodine receptor 1 n=1 Tax=Geospiza fortis TaxID=48883 RepID=A0A6I9ZE85_GEOFO
ILEVLYCVLIESPEVLNIIQENHIKSIISLLDKHGRNHKIVLPPHLERIREKLAENIHELWALTRIEQGWTYGPVRDDVQRLHPCLLSFHSLPEPERGYNLQMSGETLKTLLALGCHVGMADEKAEENLKKIKLPKTWDIKNKRNPRLVPYNLLDEGTKATNRESLCQAVRTLLGYGYNIEPPDQETPSQGAVPGGPRAPWPRLFRAKRGSLGAFQAVTAGEMRVGWARPGLRPDTELGADDMAFVFNGHRAQRWHVGGESFGRPWQAGDVVGCLIDLGECHMSFTLNGEVLIGDAGSEVAFRDFEVADGEGGAQRWHVGGESFGRPWQAGDVAQRWHVGGESFGRPWQAGDVVGCLIDLGECHMSFTLNGEVLIGDAGSEVAFRDFEVADGEGGVPGLGDIPPVSPGHPRLGQDVGTLRYFGICGLQEGYEPFAINMKRPIALWFSHSLPQFIPVPPEHPQLKVIMNTTTYYYSVRLFAGQEPGSAWVGWVTPHFHQHDPDFELSRVRSVTVTMGDDRGNVHDSIKRSNCYMVWGGEFATPTQQARVSHTDLVIGCLVDLATGLMTFTANGKEINTFFQVEPNTKLFPAVFVQPTTQNVLQFELGKLKNIMPISAAMFSSERQNPAPQCPPRLVIQHLSPVTWSRMPTEYLAVESARLGERQGWAVECSEPLQMMALHIPEEDRWEEEEEEEEVRRRKAIEAGELQAEEEDEEEARRTKAIEAGEVQEEEEKEEEEELEEGLLQMKLPESVKLQMCHLLQHLCEQELQHQINMLMQYKGGAEDEECPVPGDIRDELLDFHNDLLAHCGIELTEEEEEEEEEMSLRQRLLGLVQKVVGVRGPPKEEETPPEEPPVPSTLQELISQTMVHWAQESFIQSPALVRAMFSLLHRQYDALGELGRALPKAYAISATSVPDTTALLECLGQIRSLLIVQMGPEEENLMIQSIGHPLSCLCHPHLGHLLENSSIALGMQGSPPLDVAAASVIDNNELALALKEQDLEKVVTYLASCGLQSCPMLLAKGYPDIGWNPCGGEKYLDFLRFAVFVNGESVEENANVVVRLLIRRPQCWDGLGDPRVTPEPSDPPFPPRFGPEEPPEENRVHLGHAIMSFYAALIDLLGRCAPEMHLIQAGKGEALRIRAILRSLVPLEDLVGIISLPLQIPALGKDGNVVEPRMAASFVPEHKAPMVLFLDRVYGVQNQEFLLHVLEVGFLPDMRAAASLDTATFSTTEMALALNRYLCLAVMPLITKCAPLFAGTEHRAIMVDSMLHTIYRLSRGRALTKAQRDAIEECLMALCRWDPEPGPEMAPWPPWVGIWTQN